MNVHDLEKKYGKIKFMQYILDALEMRYNLRVPEIAQKILDGKINEAEKIFNILIIDLKEVLEIA